MKKEWKDPVLQSLNISNTNLENRANASPDCFDGSNYMPPGQQQFCPPDGEPGVGS